MAAHAMIDIAGDRLAAAIDPFGAELKHLRDADGRELMTDADPAYWPSHAPILFPNVGRLHGDVLRVDGVEYPMRQHGFARRLMWEVAVHEADHARFRLVSSEQTRPHYPFEFLLEMDFRLDGDTLALDARVENRSDRLMPASLGFHPAFAWPLPFGQPREDHRIIFEADEPGRLKSITRDGLIAEGERDSPLDDRELLLRDALFTDDALVWDPIHSASLTYGAARGPVLRIAFPNTPKLGIWTKPGGRFVCVEPWYGIADPEGYTGEFRDKPGVFLLAPGEDKKIRMSVTLEP